MKLLLDAHSLIWHSDSSPQMSPRATVLLNDPANELVLSMASVWEIAIKVGMKKLTLSVPFVPFLERATTTYQVTVLPITLDDCIAYEQLAFPDPKHRDPFDRMIITHALRNAFSVVGSDTAFDAYGIIRLW